MEYLEDTECVQPCTDNMGHDFKYRKLKFSTPAFNINYMNMLELGAEV